jgi:hypothetical protein
LADVDALDVTVRPGRLRRGRRATEGAATEVVSFLPTGAPHLKSAFGTTLIRGAVLDAVSANGVEIVSTYERCDARVAFRP